jgi:hypothetical protein
MNDPLTTLCIIPHNAKVKSDWSAIGCDSGSFRKIHACFTNIDRYENDKAVRIREWPICINDCSATKDYSITVEEMHTFPELVELMDRLAPKETGVFVYNGQVSPVCHSSRPTGSKSVLHYNYKMCMKYPRAEYAGAFASSLTELWGFDPDVVYGEPFCLGWFPNSDPIASRIIQRYNEWPDNKCSPMLPAGPSPSENGIELVGLGRDMAFIGICAGDFILPDLTPALFRSVFGKDTIVAGVDTPNFLDWMENHFALSDLIPIDQPLPFV